MTKAYSNKALPSGTILREWRLEEVLGVGGFGIVYKGRGIYFNELVAIKEYFPSSISERDDEDTVVPIDSDAEEVHALGLKKFVEEAKLLWNLSTPTRHPNIVNVRSLFEIHGTAYMVMDFEDGVSLSKMLKNGVRFNERSLLDLIRPIAEGLERAHRVGVLHRDIKPPNILVNEDGRPVLIDFGSARFEAAEATSTKVTFHTPPYAAIEQYVKTYDQGPWTDIYALGVVLYECVTGTKPPEVLERLHGGLGTALADGKWPGYSKRFLAAIDAAMTIKPNERPQSISEWLTMFEGSGKRDRSAAIEIDEDATRVVPFNTAADAIVPVAPPAAGFATDEPLETGVPADPSQVEFKRSGHDTSASKKAAAAGAAVAGAAVVAKAGRGKKGTEETPAEETFEPAVATDSQPADASAATAGPEPAVAPSGDDKAKATPDKESSGRKLSPALLGGGAIALLVAVGGGWAMFGGGGTATETDAIIVENATAGVADLNATTASEGLAAAVKTLADEARTAGAPASALDGITTAAEQLATLEQEQQGMASGASDERTEQIRSLAQSAAGGFANALASAAESESRRLARANASRGRPADRQRAAATVRNALANLRSAAAGASAAPDVGQSLTAAQRALAQWQTFSAVSAAAYTGVEAVERPTPEVAAPRTAAPTQPKRGPATAAAAEPESSSTSTGVSAAKLSQFNGIIADGRAMAKQVIRMGERNRPGPGASAQERAAYEVRRANVPLARNYDSHLAKLKDTMRGMNSDREADTLIKQANQTKAYLQFLVKQSTEAMSR